MPLDRSMIISEIVNKNVLWGVASTSIPHIGYLPYLVLMKKLSESNNVKFLISDIHGYLDSAKTEWNDVDSKDSYSSYFDGYKFTEKVRTSEFYFNEDYISLILKYSPYFNVEDILQSSEKCLKNDLKLNANAADILYFIMMAVDLIYLRIDVVLVGLDEVEIYENIKEVLKKEFDYDIFIIQLPMFPGVQSDEMHSSDSNDNKINLNADFLTVCDQLEEEKKQSLKLYLERFINRFNIDPRLNGRDLGETLVSLKDFARGDG